jgi:hypothetical protein
VSGGSNCDYLGPRYRDKLGEVLAFLENPTCRQPRYTAGQGANQMSDDTHYAVGWSCACGWAPDYTDKRGLGLQQCQHIADATGKDVSEVIRESRANLT